MSPAARIALLWAGFAVTHVGLSSLPVRTRLVARLGERAFQGVYSLVAFAFFIPLVTTFFGHKHDGRWLWVFTRGPALHWTLYVGMAIALVLVVASLVRPSPAGVVPGDPTPRGVYRITRHPLVMGLALFGALHVLPNGTTADVAFFGGFVLFGLLLRRSQAFEPLQQLFLGHPLHCDLGVVGIDAGAGRADQRHGIGFGLIDLHELLQGVHQLLAQILRRNRGIGDFAERNHRVLVIIAIDGQL